MTSSQQQQRNLHLAQGGLEGWIRGDREATMGTLTEDVEVYVPPELGNAGTYRGRDSFLAWIGHWDEAWSDFEMSIERAQPVGERHVVFLVRSRGRGRGSGVEVENVLGWVLGVRGDHCDYIALQPDLDSAVELARVRETD
jgi:ketosteroid isomerase-like protein